jgi:hypothetical protein
MSAAADEPAHVSLEGFFLGVEPVAGRLRAPVGRGAVEREWRRGCAEDGAMDSFSLGVAGLLVEEGANVTSTANSG